MSHQCRCPTYPSRSSLPSETEIRQRMLHLPEGGTPVLSSANGRSRCGPSRYGRYLGKRSEGDRFHVWVRATGPAARRAGHPPMRARLRVGHELLDAALIPHGRSLFSDEFMAASLDHAMWFHRPFRADEWMLYVAGQSEPRRLARVLPRRDLRQRRYSGRLGGAGRTAAATPSEAGIGAAPNEPRLLRGLPPINCLIRARLADSVDIRSSPPGNAP